MGRPTKIGLDYFPTDVDMYEDEKIEFVSAKFGLKGEAIVGRLLSRIYRNGYYIEWNEDVNILFAKRIGNELSVEEINSIIEELLDRNFFNKHLFNEFRVLTSRGIQKRYVKTCQDSGRKNYSIEVNFDLIGFNSEKTEVNSQKTPVNSEVSTQSKVKESKVKEKRRDKSKVKEKRQVTYDDFFSLFLLTFNTEPTDKERNQLKKSINAEPDITINVQYELFKEVCQTITNSKKSPIKNKPINEKKAYLFGTFRLKQQDFWAKKNIDEAEELKKEYPRLGDNEEITDLADILKLNSH